MTEMPPEASPIMAQIGMLNLRINAMIAQLNITMKAMMEENAVLRKNNADLKALPKNSADAKQEKTSKS